MTTTIERSSMRRRAGALMLAACWLLGPAAQAAPTLPQVVNGQATFNQQGNVFSITNTPGAIINWQSFNIGAGEITRFIQQSSDSAVLNRIVGQDPTRILGALQSNGKVFLINPNGILFGQGSRVDVNGLVASTLNLSDADFLAGKKNFEAGPGAVPGSVRNDGAITTPGGGKVFLIAPNVENNGIVAAPGGEVVLAAGRSVQLADSSDPNLQVVISAPADQALNLGKVIADGGRIGIYGALVNQRGALNADSAVVGANGRIVLKASGAATLAAGSATSARAAGKGGEIQVLGKQVAIEGQASVDASGRLGGGAVLVGGDYQGGGGVQRAQSADVAAGASLRADATVAGAGGKVVVWSDGTTRAAGSISAHGAGSGKGGLVETSGHLLDVNGITVDAAGGKVGNDAGSNGTWLLDPYDIEVVAGGASTDSLTKLAPATLTAAGTDIVLQAEHNLTFTNALNAAAGVRAQAGNDINVNAQVSSSGGDLDFRAGNALNINAAGALRSANYIDIAANRVTLAGTIGKLTGTQLPILSFTSTDPARPIVVGAGTADANALWLDAAALGRISAGLFELNLGNSRHTGAVSIKADLTASSSLVMENGGRIAVDAKVDLTSNPDSRVFANLYGGVDSKIQVTGTLAASKTVALDGGSGAVEISPLARVSSATGAVSIAGATTQVPSGTVSQGGDQPTTPTTPTTPTPPPPPPPPLTLDICLATPGAAGCADLIAKEIQACTLFPNGANCGKVMPTLETCQVNPAAPGCGVVLAHHDIDVCLANPQQPGCAAKIPTYEACRADAAGYGCGTVIQRHDQVTACIVNPAAPGCAATLPTLAQCRADAGIYGCAPVLARAQFDACVAHPEGAGCMENVLPKLAVCKLTPSLDGCAQVLEMTFQACLANPNDAGCSGVLPTLSQCVINSAARGCDAVLPTLSQCIGSPGLQGCSVRLPSLQACVASPAAPGCGAVLPTLAQCTGNPALPGCTVVLPSLQTCAASPANPGCSAVLPTLAQCVVSPGLQGCNAVLPSLQACAASPAMPGCEAVLPKPDFCSTHPSDPGCAVFGGNSGSGVTAEAKPVAQAVQNTVQLINQGKGATGATPAPGSGAGSGPAPAAGQPAEGQDNKNPEQNGKTAGPAQADNTGAKNEKPATKMYCN